MHALSLPEVSSGRMPTPFPKVPTTSAPRKMPSRRRALGARVPGVLDVAVANSNSGSPEGESGESGQGDGGDEIPRTDRTKKILGDADRRDDEAAARDIAADERAEAADLQAFLNVGEDYAGQRERRAAALDRAHAKCDREKSADDRAHLSEVLDPDDEGTVP